MLLNCGAGGDSWESLGLQGDPTILKEINTEYSMEGLTLKLKLQYLVTWCEEQLTGKDPDSGKDWRQEEKAMTEDEMVGWHHQLDGHEFEQAPGVWWWMGKPGVLQSMGSQRVGLDWVTELNWMCPRSWGKGWRFKCSVNNYHDILPFLEDHCVSGMCQTVRLWSEERQQW